MTSNWTRVAAALGFLGVGLGAFGAHGLEDSASAQELDWWATATLYHLLHVPPLLALDAWRDARGTRLAGYAFTCGVIVFCGTLYALGLGGPSWLGAVTPFGGLALMLGWAALCYASTAGRATRAQKEA